MIEFIEEEARIGISREAGLEGFKVVEEGGGRRREKVRGGDAGGD